MTELYKCDTGQMNFINVMSAKGGSSDYIWSVWFGSTLFA